MGTYSGCDSRSDHICSAPAPRATARVIMSLTTRCGCISIFVYWFKLRASVSALMLDVAVRSTLPLLVLAVTVFVLWVMLPIECYHGVN